MSIENVEGEHDRVLSRIEVGDNVDIHGTDHHRDANYHQHETQLQHVGWVGGREYFSYLEIFTRSFTNFFRYMMQHRQGCIIMLTSS